MKLARKEWPSSVPHLPSCGSSKGKRVCWRRGSGVSHRLGTLKVQGCAKAGSHRQHSEAQCRASADRPTTLQGTHSSSPEDLRPA